MQPFEMKHKMNKHLTSTLIKINNVLDILYKI